MKILPLIKGIQKDIASTKVRMKLATVEGYNIANRTSNVYKQDWPRKYINVVRCVTNKILSGTTRNEIPYLAGAIGLIIPIPFMSPILFGLGMIARIPSKGASIACDKQSESHIDINV